MRSHVLALALLATAGLLACEDTQPTDAVPAPTPVPATPVAPQPAGAPEAPRASEGEPAFVIATTSVRRLPNDEKQIDDPKTGKKIANFSATLFRGERVSVLKLEGDWSLVRASDEGEGWLKKDALLPATNVTMATVLDETKTFDRPDLLALNSKRALERGTLVFVTKTREQFSEVHLGGKILAWVLTEALVQDGREVDVAKLLNRARYLEERKDAAAEAVMELAKKSFGDTKLMQLVQGIDPNAAAQPTPPSPPSPAAPAPTPGQAPTPPTGQEG